MKLSVIIACKNAANTVATQLQALANQYWPEPWEVIVSDNGSTDNTVAVVDQYREVLPNLRIVDSSDKQGPAHARNVAARVANGESLLFCDADDEVAPDWLAAMARALSRYDFVAGSIDIVKLNDPWTRKNRCHPQRNGIQKYDYPPYLPHAGGGTIGVKRRIHESIGGFDESMINLSDTDYCWRIQLKGVELHFVPEAVIHVRFRHCLKGIYRQASRYGEYNVNIYKKYLPMGIPRLSWKDGVLSWKNLIISFLKRSRKIRDKGDLAYWTWQFGWHIGRLKGSIKYKTFAL